MEEMIERFFDMLHRKCVHKSSPRATRQNEDIYDLAAFTCRFTSQYLPQGRTFPLFEQKSNGKDYIG